MSCQPLNLPTPKPGPRCVHLFRSYNVPISLTAGQLRTDIKQIIDTDADWLWRGISVPSTSALSTISIRLQVGDYFLSNALVPLSVYAWNGYLSRAWEREMFVERGARISFEASNSGGTTFNGSVLLLGLKLVERAQ